MACVTARPFLMFQGEASAALDLYAATFPGAEILAVDRYGAEGPGPEGTVRMGRFRVADQEILCIDSPAPHAFTFTPSVSLFVECDSETDVTAIADTLADGGAVLRARETVRPAPIAQVTVDGLVCALQFAEYVDRGLNSRGRCHDGRPSRSRAHPRRRCAFPEALQTQ